MLIGYRPRGSVPALVMGIVLGWAAAFGLLFAIWPAVTVAGAPWERAWLMSAHHTFTGGLYTAAVWISSLGYSKGITIVTLLFMAAWAIRGFAWKSLMLAVDGVVLWTVDHFSKDFFSRARPELFPHTTLDSYAYPSGHALFAMGYFGFIAYLLARDARPGVRRAVWVGWALFALAMGGSRLALGVHWPTDVLAGYAAGGVFLAGVAWGTSRAWPGARRIG